MDARHLTEFGRKHYPSLSVLFRGKNRTEKQEGRLGCFAEFFLGKLFQRFVENFVGENIDTAVDAAGETIRLFAVLARQPFFELRRDTQPIFIIELMFVNAPEQSSHIFHLPLLIITCFHYITILVPLSSIFGKFFEKVLFFWDY